MSKKLFISFLPVVLLLQPVLSLRAQTYEEITYEYYQHYFYLYDFTMGNDVNVKYFPQNSAYQYESWNGNQKNVVLLCSGAFSESWDSNSKPVGLTVDNGVVINKNIDATMDGLVLIQDGYVSVIDLDALETGMELSDGNQIKINPRKSIKDKLLLLEAAKQKKMTIFQTQLVYSYLKATNFNNINYGKERERRFLAICVKNDKYHNIIIDIPDYLPLNKAAKYTKEVLDFEGYKSYFILNLDTGDKNVFYNTNGNNQLTSKGKTFLTESTNLLVFYK